MGNDERAVGRPARDTQAGSLPEAGTRPISEALRRHAVFLTSAQSDALARLLVPGIRRLVEVFALRNGTLCATLKGGGHAALRIYVAPDGRVVENEEASQPDPLGEETEPFVLARDPDRLHLGTLLPAQKRTADAERGESGRLASDGESLP